jgi:hypothetical protein
MPPWQRRDEGRAGLGQKQRTLERRHAFCCDLRPGSAKMRHKSGAHFAHAGADRAARQAHASLRRPRFELPVTAYGDDAEPAAAKTSLAAEAVFTDPVQ